MVRKIEACGVEKDTMINNLIIRQETEEDYKKTELMIMRSFWNKYWPGNTPATESARYMITITMITADKQKHLSTV